MDKTTIRVSQRNRDRLADRGHKDETFDDILGNLLDRTDHTAQITDGGQTDE